jgi:hypothetical protein
MPRRFRAYLKLPHASPIYGKPIEFDDETDEEVAEIMQEEADKLMWELCSNRHWEEVK